MRRSLKPQSFRRWRKRVHQKVSIKHRRKFVLARQQESIWRYDQIESEID